MRCWRGLKSPLDCKEIKPVNPKGNQSWIFIGNSNTLAIWCEELTHWKRPWCWERLRAGGEGDDRGWDGWMALPTWWTWVWASSESWWWTGRPGVLQSMGSQAIEHDWATELKAFWKYTDTHISIQSWRFYSCASIKIEERKWIHLSHKIDIYMCVCVCVCVCIYIYLHEEETLMFLSHG